MAESACTFEIIQISYFSTHPSADWNELMKKCHRGWYFRNKKSEKTLGTLTLASLESGLTRARREGRIAQRVAHPRLGTHLFL